MRTLYDAVTPENIPRDAQMVAGYIDGHVGVWSAAQWGYFPGAIKVRIAVRAWTNDGNVLDVETGDATPDQAPAWVQMRRGAGQHPSVYCSTSFWPSVRAAFAAQGVAEPEYWIAAYPGIGPQLYAGSVAHQYADPGPYDLSVVADQWPGVDAGGPPPVPPSKRTGFTGMLCRNTDIDEYGPGSIYLVAPGHAHHVPDMDTVNHLLFVGVANAGDMHGLEIVAWAMRFGAWDYGKNAFRS